jgi:hypothetical protein
LYSPADVQQLPGPPQILHFATVARRFDRSAANAYRQLRLASGFVMALVTRRINRLDVAQSQARTSLQAIEDTQTHRGLHVCRGTEFERCSRLIACVRVI